MPASTPYSKASPSVGRSKSDNSLMRNKNGCITCRVRQKKCAGIASGETCCVDCLRLNIHCLGVQHNRPDWLRNVEALKETKYRIKHHLTEYPVPRGKGPVTERPFLHFHDLIEKYSPQRFPASGSSSPSLSSDLYSMEPDSPVSCITSSQSSNHLSVLPGHYASASTPSPSTSCTPMPLTPTSSGGSLFRTPDGCNYTGSMYSDNFMNQPGTTYHEPAYIPELPGYAHIQPPLRPYRHQHSGALFLADPVNPAQFNFEYQDYAGHAGARCDY